MSNRTSLSSPDDIQAMLEDVSPSSSSPFASITQASRPGESTSIASMSEGGLLMELSKGKNKIELDKEVVSMAKRYPAVLLTKVTIDEICCGYIGTHKKLFCLKTRDTCPILAKHGSHSTSKFTPSPNSLYICKSPDLSSAWCDVSYTCSMLLSELDDFDLKESRSLDDWKTLFKIWSDKSKNLKGSELNKTLDTLSAPKLETLIKSPSKIKTPQNFKVETKSLDDFKTQEFINMKSEFKVLNPEMLNLFEQVKPNEVKRVLEAHHADLANVIKHISSNIQNWSTVEDLVNDVELISSYISNLKQMIGTNNYSLFPSIWNGIEEIWAITDGFNLEDISDSVNQTSMDIVTLKDSSEKLSQYWDALVMNWLPRISKLEQVQQELNSKLDELLRKQNAPLQRSNLDFILQGSNQQPTPSFQQSKNAPDSITTANFNALEKTVLDMKTELDTLKKGQVNSSQNPNNVNPISSSHNPNSSNLGLSGVRYRQYYFSTPDDLENWMRSVMTHPSHGLFVNLVSFSEFFGADRYVERNTTLNEIYMSSKIGYSTVADSIVASSFQNVLPAAYGRPISSNKSNEQELTAQPELPGLPSFSKWDNRDGRNGRRFWIREEARKTEQQLDGCIRSQLQGSVQMLAKDLLMDSFSMSDALYTFISTSYEDTMHSGRFDTDQAWTLTCSFVKRIFQEISHERVIARDGIDVDDHWGTSSKFLFATLKAHSIMAEFMKLSIKDHPSISSEMVKFVCYSQPTADSSEMLSRLSGLESLQRADQSNISKLDNRIKKIESWKGDSDKLLKKLKEKAGI